MTDLSSASEAELQAELERRQRAAAVPTPQAKPITEVDWSRVHRAATELVRYAIQDGYFDDAAPQYVYEAAMEAVFGKGYWEWRNAKG